MKKKIAAFLLSIAVAASAFMQLPAFASVEKAYELKTNENPNFYSNFSVSGFTITASGKYAEDSLKTIYTSDWDISKYSLKSLPDGTYTAELTLEPYSNNTGYIILVLQSGAFINYRLFADENGLYFPDNKLGALNAEKFEHIITAPTEAAAYYLSATADSAEIKQTQEKLKALADEITAGVTDEYEQARLICRWVADNVYYDSDASHTSVTLETVAISNVLKIKRTVCAGYANTCSALMAAKGIRSVNIKGSAASGEVSYENLATGVENHEWSAFFYEKENRWVYVDACWCSGNHYVNGEYIEDFSSDEYFDISPLAFSFDHRVDKIEERDYFTDFSVLEDAASEQSTAATEATEITTVTEVSTEPAAPNVTSEITTSDSPASSSDNTVLIVILASVASALLIGVIVIALYLKKRNGKNQ